MRLTLLIFLSSFVFVPKTFAGAWGTGAFDNDGALDWFSTLESKGSNALISTTLDSAFIDGYLEMNVCIEAIAASEVVASLKDRKYSGLPKNIVTIQRIFSDKYKPSNKIG